MTTYKKVAERKSAQARTTLNAYRRLFSTEDGQTVLKDLMKSCFYLSPTIGKDSHETYLNEGMRMTVMRILRTSKMTGQDIEKLSEAINKENDGLFVD